MKEPRVCTVCRGAERLVSVSLIIHVKRWPGNYLTRTGRRVLFCESCLLGIGGERGTRSALYRAAVGLYKGIQEAL